MQNGFMHTPSETEFLKYYILSYFAINVPFYVYGVRIILDFLFLYTLAQNTLVVSSYIFEVCDLVRVAHDKSNDQVSTKDPSTDNSLQLTLNN